MASPPREVEAVRAALTLSLTLQMAKAIFGYGSLIFKPPPFAGLTSEAGYIKDHVRRFAQKSHDHRGTEEHPGRGADR